MSARLERRGIGSRAGQLVVALCFCAGLWALPSAWTVFATLHASARGSLLGWDRLVEDLSTPRSGESVLAEYHREAIGLLRRHDIDRYRLSAEFGSLPFDKQRVIEGAWPIRYDPDARFEISYMSEETACEIVEERIVFYFPKVGVRLARCP